MSEPQGKSARLLLVLIALVFFGPLIVAAWMYYGGHFAGLRDGSNHGALLEPIVNLGDELPQSVIHDHIAGQWLLVYADSGECGEPCRRALFTSRQSRTMLGKEMERMSRVFLHGETPLDTVSLATEHPQLITIEDASLADFLDIKRPTELPPGGYYLIDPLGNLVMYFRPDIVPSDMVDDIRHLLRLSRIG
jgi:hypothetical protein